MGSRDRESHPVPVGAGAAGRGTSGCILGRTQRLVLLLRLLPLLLFPLHQLHPLQVPLTEFLLVGGQVLGLTGGEFLSHKLGGQSQKTFGLNSVQLLQFRPRGLLEATGSEKVRGRQEKEDSETQPSPPLNAIHLFAGKGGLHLSSRGSCPCWFLLLSG